MSLPKCSASIPPSSSQHDQIERSECHEALKQILNVKVPIDEIEMEHKFSFSESEQGCPPKQRELYPGAYLEENQMGATSPMAPIKRAQASGAGTEDFVSELQQVQLHSTYWVSKGLCFAFVTIAPQVMATSLDLIWSDSYDTVPKFLGYTTLVGSQVSLIASVGAICLEHKRPKIACIMEKIGIAAGVLSVIGMGTTSLPKNLMWLSTIPCAAFSAILTAAI